MSRGEPVGLRPDPEDPEEVRAFRYLFERGIDEESVIHTRRRLLRVMRYDYDPFQKLCVVLVECDGRGVPKEGYAEQSLRLPELEAYLKGDWTVYR